MRSRPQYGTSLHQRQQFTREHRLLVVGHDVGLVPDHAGRGRVLATLLLDDLRLDVDGVADERRVAKPHPVDPVEGDQSAVGVACLPEQAGHHREDEGAVGDALPEVGVGHRRRVGVEVVEVATDPREVHEVGLGDGPASRRERVADRDVLEVHAGTCAGA